MQPLKIIWDPYSFEWKDYVVRHTARAIIFDSDKKIAIMHVKKFSYHKLPGGWVEEGEDIETALRRECLEEVWVEISDIEPIGDVLEWRNGIEEYNEWVYIQQISHCFRAEVLTYHSSELTEYEKLDESEIIWITLDEAIRILENDTPANIEWEWIRQRELAFLKNYYARR